MHFFALLHALQVVVWYTTVILYTDSHIDTTALIVTGNITSLVVLILCSRYFCENTHCHAAQVLYR